MQTVNVTQAIQGLEKLIDLTLHSDDVVITRSGYHALVSLYTQHHPCTICHVKAKGQRTHVEEGAGGTSPSKH